MIFTAQLSFASLIRGFNVSFGIRQSIVGVNCWVASANRSVFGEDADNFRPERWLSDDGSVSQMEQYLLAVSFPYLSV